MVKKEIQKFPNLKEVRGEQGGAERTPPRPAPARPAESGSCALAAAVPSRPEELRPVPAPVHRHRASAASSRRGSGWGERKVWWTFVTFGFSG